MGKARVPWIGRWVEGYGRGVTDRMGGLLSVTGRVMKPTYLIQTQR